MADRWQVIKGCVPVQICDTIEEAEGVYAAYECDEIRRIKDDEEQPLLVTPRRNEPNPIWDGKKGAKNAKNDLP